MASAVLAAVGFDALGHREASQMGLTELPIVTIPHEFFGFTDQQIADSAEPMVDGVVHALTTKVEDLVREHAAGPWARKGGAAKAKANVEELADIESPTSAYDALDLFYQRGWTDGLPIIPPTDDLVSAMMAYSDRSPDDIVGVIKPRDGKATVEKVAVNAVMAGCRPEYFPVVLAAVEAVAEPAFNLYTIQATTNPIAPLVLVNGPIAKELDMNWSFNAFGQGRRSNATIGRALRLVMMNIGGGIPGAIDKAIHGLPHKYTFCAAENEAESPWPSLAEERGAPKGSSAVTVIGVLSAQNWVTWASSPGVILSTAANAMSAMGTNNTFHGGPSLLVLNPGHAQILAKAGYSKDDVKRFMFTNARYPVGKLHPEEIQHYQLRRPQYNWGVPMAELPIADKWEDIFIAVVGAVGMHGLFMPTHGDPSKPTTKVIRRKDGTPVASVNDLRRK